MHYKFRKRPTFDHPLSQHSNASFDKSLKKLSKKLHFRQRIPNYLPDLESCPVLPGLARDSVDRELGSKVYPLTCPCPNTS